MVITYYHQGLVGTNRKIMLLNQLIGHELFLRFDFSSFDPKGENWLVNEWFRVFVLFSGLHVSTHVHLPSL